MTNQHTINKIRNVIPQCEYVEDIAHAIGIEPHILPRLARSAGIQLPPFRDRQNKYKIDQQVYDYVLNKETQITKHLKITLRQLFPDQTINRPYREFQIK